MVFFFFQAEDGIRDYKVTGVQTCALPISQNRNALPVPQELLREPDNHRRLAGTPNGQIPDTDDRPFQALLFEPPVGIEPNPRANSATIEQREGPQQSPQ